MDKNGTKKEYTGWYAYGHVPSYDLGVAAQATWRSFFRAVVGRVVRRLRAV